MTNQNVVPSNDHIVAKDEEQEAAAAFKRRVLQIIAIIFLGALLFLQWQSSQTIEVTIGAGSSPIAEINRLNPPTSEKVERKNYLTGIRMAQACAIPVYKAERVSHHRMEPRRITYTEARDSAGTTDRFLVSVPVYFGDMLSTRGGDRCREAPNTRPFGQR